MRKVHALVHRRVLLFPGALWMISLRAVDLPESSPLEVRRRAPEYPQSADSRIAAAGLALFGLSSHLPASSKCSDWLRL
ncbi:MAG: hypothetical protein JKY63_01290 [Rhodobiaceae bacterium]|nr:hypothetical protein [Rhodobiaceae bacterium]